MVQRQKLIQRRLFREGVKQGYVHEWDYPNGRWIEKKISKRDWVFKFASAKHKTNQRKTRGKIQPPINFRILWKIDALQTAIKTGRGEYQTQMVGKKTILGFYDPTKNKWVRLQKPKIQVFKIDSPRRTQLNAMGVKQMARTYRTKKGNLVRYRNGVKYYYNRKLKRWIRSRYQSKGRKSRRTRSKRPIRRKSYSRKR